MRERTHMGRAIGAALADLDWPQQRLSAIAHIDQGTINRIINRKRRPDIATLRALCTCWTDPVRNARIMVEHLRDEVEAAGHADGSIIIAPSGAATDTRARHTLDLIRAADPDLYSHICALLSGVWHALSGDRPARMLAAEAPGDYGRRSPNRKTVKLK